MLNRKRGRPTCTNSNRVSASTWKSLPASRAFPARAAIAKRRNTLPGASRMLAGESTSPPDRIIVDVEVEPGAGAPNDVSPLINPVTASNTKEYSRTGDSNGAAIIVVLPASFADQ